MRRIDPPALGVFLILLGSYAFFWHSRDWNTGQPADADLRHGGPRHRRDHGAGAADRRHRPVSAASYYSDKLPGYPLLAAVPYAVLRWVFHFPPHPLGERGMKYWPADYWITLGTSGLLTAWTGALLVLLARDLGCTPARLRDDRAWPMACRRRPTSTPRSPTATRPPPSPCWPRSC